MIRLDMANIVTIGLCGALGYGVLIGVGKLWTMFQANQGAA
jgi:hypothetical protein